MLKGQALHLGPSSLPSRLAFSHGILPVVDAEARSRIFHLLPYPRPSHFLCVMGRSIIITYYIPWTNRHSFLTAANPVVDAVSLLPPCLRTDLSRILHEFYVSRFRDKFFEINPPPAWFGLFIWMELLYHVPLSVWATLGLWKSALTFLQCYTFCNVIRSVLTGERNDR